MGHMHQARHFDAEYIGNLKSASSHIIQKHVHDLECRSPHLHAHSSKCRPTPCWSLLLSLPSPSPFSSTNISPRLPTPTSSTQAHTHILTAFSSLAIVVFFKRTVQDQDTSHTNTAFNRMAVSCQHTPRKVSSNACPSWVSTKSVSVATADFDTFSKARMPSTPPSNTPSKIQ